MANKLEIMLPWVVARIVQSTFAYNIYIITSNFEGLNDSF